MDSLYDEMIIEAAGLEDSIKLDQSVLLSDINWDSLAHVSLMVIFDDKFKKQLDPEKLSALITVADLRTYLSDVVNDQI